MGCDSSWGCWKTLKVEISHGMGLPHGSLYRGYHSEVPTRVKDLQVGNVIPGFPACSLRNIIALRHWSPVFIFCGFQQQSVNAGRMQINHNVSQNKQHLKVHNLLQNRCLGTIPIWIQLVPQHSAPICPWNLTWILDNLILSIAPGHSFIWLSSLQASQWHQRATSGFSSGTVLSSAVPSAPARCLVLVGVKQTILRFPLPPELMCTNIVIVALASAVCSTGYFSIAEQLEDTHGGVCSFWNKVPCRWPDCSRMNVIRWCGEGHLYFRLASSNYQKTSGGADETGCWHAACAC